MILRSAIRVEDIQDPIHTVEAMFNRVERDELLRFYRIAQFEKTEEFLG